MYTLSVCACAWCVRACVRACVCVVRACACALEVGVEHSRIFMYSCGSGTMCCWGVRKSCEADTCDAQGKEKMNAWESEAKLENKYIKA